MQCRSIKEFVKKVQTQKKPIDILVNNASIFITGDAVTEDGLEVWLDPLFRLQSC